MARALFPSRLSPRGLSSRALALAIAAAVGGCTTGTQDDDGGTAADAGPSPDESSPDGGPLDGGRPDAGEDEALPSVSFAAPADGTVTNVSVLQVALVVDGDPALVALEIDGQRVAELTAPWTYAWDLAQEDEGPHELRALAANTAGVIESAPLRVVVDRTAPLLLSTSPSDEAEHVRFDARVRLRLSEEVVGLDASTLTFATDPGGVALSPSFSSDLDGLEVWVDLTPLPIAPTDVVAFLGTGVSDLAGNALAPETFRWHVPVFLVDEVTDTGSYSDIAVAINDDDALTVAFVEGTDIVVRRRLPEGLWSELERRTPADLRPKAPGDRLALVATAEGSVLAWRDGDAVRARRYTTDTAYDLGVRADEAGGGVDRPALVVDADGAVIAVFDEAGSLRARRFGGTSWSDVGASLGTLPSSPVAVVDEAGTMSVGWREDSLVRLASLQDDQWTAIVDVASAPGVGRPRLATDAGGGLIVSVDASGTWHMKGGVVTRVSDPAFVTAALATRRALMTVGATTWAAAVERPVHEPFARVSLRRSVGSGWQAFGPTLDVVADGAALDVSLDGSADGRHAVAWLEEAGGGLVTPRVARRNAAPDAPAPRGLVDVGSAPGCLASPPVDNSSLSETGCFVDLVSRDVVEGVLPYDVRTALWSDGASKRRFLALPPGEGMGYHETAPWDLPDGTVLIKEFSIEAVTGDLTTLRPVETRFLVVRTDSTWERYSYEWNAEATDAFLREAFPADSVVAYDVVDEDGLPATREHFFPSRGQCTQCHTLPGKALGLETAQMNRDFDYGRAVENQLWAFYEEGLFGTSLEEDELLVAPAMPNAYDTAHDVERRLRSYQHANCAHCHAPLFGLHLKWHVPTVDTSAPIDSGLCDKIVVGDPGASRLYERDVLWTPSAMPPLGVRVQDPLVSELVTGWIVSDDNPCP